MMENTPMIIPESVRNARNLLAFNVFMEIRNNSDIDKPDFLNYWIYF